MSEIISSKISASISPEIQKETMFSIKRTVSKIFIKKLSILILMYVTFCTVLVVRK